ncbi:hypothetical protein [Larkinella soli]|uniref:hypothetical protein n=1 Tax=Larkinella soli TaxID=1770527 RepID=UPI000FFCAB05|nr:hypothetical protein [Larkinella soli]
MCVGIPILAGFISILTIFLAESGASLTTNPTELITARLMAIVLGSVIGAVGGRLLYHERLQHLAIRRLRQTRIAMKKRRL